MCPIFCSPKAKKHLLIFCLTLDSSVRRGVRPSCTSMPVNCGRNQQTAARRVWVWCAAQVSPSGTSVCSQCSDLFTRRPASSAGSETPGGQQFGGLNAGTHDRRFGLAVFRDMPQNLGCHFLRRPSSRSIAPVLRHRREGLDSKAPTQAGVLISRKA